MARGVIRDAVQQKVAFRGQSEQPKNVLGHVLFAYRACLLK